MNFLINGQYAGDISDYVSHKLSFLEDFLQEGAIVALYIKTNKGGDLRSIKAIIEFHGRPIVVKSKNHRSLTKCVDELKDVLKRVMSETSAKLKDKKGRASISEVVSEPEPSFEEDVDADNQPDELAFDF